MRDAFNNAQVLEGKWNNTKGVNPCSPEGFSQTYFPKGGLLQPPPLDYQY